jgi:hypothetical protein
MEVAWQQQQAQQAWRNRCGFDAFLSFPVNNLQIVGRCKTYSRLQSGLKGTKLCCLCREHPNTSAAPQQGQFHGGGLAAAAGAAGLAQQVRLVDSMERCFE